MATAVFTGHSDDIVLVVGIPGGDEFDCCASYKGDTAFRFSIGPVQVLALYTGVWSFAVGLVEEGDDTWPGWAVRVSQDHGYSMRLEIDCPDDVELKRLNT